MHYLQFCLGLDTTCPKANCYNIDRLLLRHMCLIQLVCRSKYWQKSSRTSSAGLWSALAATSCLWLGWGLSPSATSACQASMKASPWDSHMLCRMQQARIMVGTTSRPQSFLLLRHCQRALSLSSVSSGARSALLSCWLKRHCGSVSVAFLPLLPPSSG